MKVKYCWCSTHSVYGWVCSGALGSLVTCTHRRNLKALL